MHRAQHVDAELARLTRRRRQRAEPTVKLRGHLEAWGRILCPEADGWGSNLMQRVGVSTSMQEAAGVAACKSSQSKALG